MSSLKLLKTQLSNISVLTLFVMLVSATDVYADFLVENGQALSTTQTLTNNQTGEIEEGGRIGAVAGEAILITGTNNKVYNAGFLKSTTTAIRTNGANNMVYNHGSIKAGATGIFIDATDNIIYNF